MIHKFECEVTQTSVVEVEIDDESMDEKFMVEFRDSICNFATLEEHAHHLAQLKAHDLIGFDSFVEGYGFINGSTKEPNVKVSVVRKSEDIEIATLETAS